jgi:hypothetical protein
LRDLFASLDLFSKFSTGPLWIFQVPFSCMEFTCLLGWWLLVVFPAVEEVAAADPARYRSTENRIHHPQFYHKWISMDGINHGINHHMAGLFLRMRMRSLPRIRLSQPVSICHIDGLLLLTSAHIQHSLQYLSYWCFTIINISSYTDTIRIPLVRTFWSILDRCEAIWFHWARRIHHRTALGPNWGKISVPFDFHRLMPNKKISGHFS